jgi:DNA ligase (NAD+)
MLSCRKAVDIEEVLKWSNGEDLFVDYKIDGLSLSLTYSEGRLIQAATRGNGTTGDDSTVATMKIKSIPKEIPIKDRLFIRGELFMPRSEFNRINTLDPDSYSSPRNLAVGTLKQKDLSLLEKRKLDFFAFELYGYKDETTFQKKKELLDSWGFHTTGIEFLGKPTQEKITEIYTTIEKERETLDFEIDGLVFKFNEAAVRETAGETAHHPKWMIALKFTSKGKITRVNDITWQVGRTGILTPVAELEPIEIAGALIQRATLHNREFLETLNVARGDQVMVIRSGDVIPKITNVEVKGKSNYTLPLLCPSCSSQLQKEGVNLICTGSECKDRDIQKIRHWIRTLDIKGLGPRSIEKLYESGVKHFTDLYDSSLTETKLVNLLGKNGSMIFRNIQKTRNLEFNLFLAGLGIENLGLQMAKTLTTHFKTWGDLQNATLSQLIQIEGISDLTGNYILSGINDPSLGKTLLEKGVEISYEPLRRRQKTIPQGTLTDFFQEGKSNKSERIEKSIGEKNDKGTVYVTGKIPDMTKKKIQALLEEHNYQWASLSKSLGMLVIGEKPGSSKLEKAKKYGIPIKRWEDFIEELMRNQ